MPSVEVRDLLSQVTGHDHRWQFVAEGAPLTRDQLDERINETSLDGQSPVVPEGFSPKVALYFKREEPWPGVDQELELHADDTQALIVDCAPDVNEQRFGLRVLRGRVGEALTALDGIWELSYINPGKVKTEEQYARARPSYDVLDELTREAA